MKFGYSCSSESCRNLADRCGDLSVCGFDMKPFERLIWSLSFNVPALSGPDCLAYVPIKPDGHISQFPWVQMSD